jgi:hypothetical protein
MRSRPLSILATSALAALLGCPFEGAGTASPDALGSADTSAIESGDVLDNSPSHLDTVDAPGDSSWASTRALDPGEAGLRLLMTDAPIAADHVFVTFCGIHVEYGAADAGDSDELSESDGDSEKSDSDDVGRDDVEKSAAPSEEEEPELDVDADLDDEQPEVELESEEDKTEDAADDSDDESDADSDSAERPGWHTVSDQCQTLDLLTLRDGVTEAVGIATLPAGDYGKIRLMLTKASIVIDGVEHELVVPSGSESGIKIGRGFRLEEGAATTITIDFDAGRSVHYAPGNGYMMSPVIDIIDVKSHDDVTAPEATDADSDSDSDDSDAEDHESDDAENELDEGDHEAESDEEDAEKAEPEETEESEDEEAKGSEDEEAEESEDEEAEVDHD